MLIFTETSMNFASTGAYSFSCLAERRLLSLQFIFGSVLGVLRVHSGHHVLLQHKQSGAGDGVCQEQSQKLQLRHIVSLPVFCFHKCCSISLPSNSRMFLLPGLIMRNGHDCLCIVSFFIFFYKETVHYIKKVWRNKRTIKQTKMFCLFAFHQRSL